MTKLSRQVCLGGRKLGNLLVAVAAGVILPALADTVTCRTKRKFAEVNASLVLSFAL